MKLGVAGPSRQCLRASQEPIANAVISNSRYPDSGETPAFHVTERSTEISERPINHPGGDAEICPCSESASISHRAASPTHTAKPRPPQHEAMLASTLFSYAFK